MATQTAAQLRFSSERKFFTGMALAMIAFVFAGFAPTYFLVTFIGGVPAAGAAKLTPLVHLHAAVSSAWLLLFLMQVSLVAADRRDIHMMIGKWALLVVAAVVVVGLTTAIEAAHLGRRPPGWSRDAFFIFPFSSAAGLAVFVLLGLLFRRRSDYHKRLMLLATLNMLIPAGARLSRLFAPIGLPPGPFGGMFLTDLFVAALVAYDIRSRGRLHPVTLWGGGAFLLSQPLRFWLAQTPQWQSIAAAIID